MLAAVRKALGRERDLVLWRNNTGSLLNARGERVTYGLAPGSADLVGILAPRGRLFALEIKRPGEEVRPEQARWLDLVRSFGGFGAVVCSPQEALDALARARAGQVG